MSCKYSSTATRFGVPTSFVFCFLLVRYVHSTYNTDLPTSIHVRTSRLSLLAPIPNLCFFLSSLSLRMAWFGCCRASTHYCVWYKAVASLVVLVRIPSRFPFCYYWLAVDLFSIFYGRLYEWHGSRAPRH
jgi:hypothetical protein